MNFASPSPPVIVFPLRHCLFTSSLRGTQCRGNLPKPHAHVKTHLPSHSTEIATMLAQHLAMTRSRPPSLRGAKRRGNPLKPPAKARRNHHRGPQIQRQTKDIIIHPLLALLEGALRKNLFTSKSNGYAFNKAITR